MPKEAPQAGARSMTATLKVMSALIALFAGIRINCILRACKIGGRR
jgi:hypothetical protein